MTNTENTTTAADTDTPRGRSAVHHVLATGYTGSTGPGVAATISLVIDGDARIVFDPGMVSHRSVITDALGELGLKTDDITDVVLSHHHPDNVMNAGLFTSARVHDHKAIYDGHGWTTRDAEGHEFTPSLRLLETPGHSHEDITLLVGTADGLVALVGDLWWRADGPAEDPVTVDRELHRASRERVLGLADVIVPGHGAPFVPDATTPR
ncbi:MBL fold metallo-hydrolase [Streptomyces sp. NBC_01304]|uniref:MBL fold metallo-hydrolase n=1 Tax=Streptomyces sp. NBC_01304 TaxID=2903818 RepID=UPI002E0E3EFA|nr:MBL fold metallo-hydrolase [Streptomyces sp. NBC_01304]